MKKWFYPILITFVVFFILSNPATAGAQVREFSGWLSKQVGAAGTFLDGLFDENEVHVDADTEPDGQDDRPGNSSTSSGDDTSNVIPPASDDGGDSFDTLAPVSG